MELRINFTAIRFWLLLALVFFAPMSLYPSVALPLFDFPSFRIGLYQLLALLFVTVSLPLLWKVLPKLKSHRPVGISLVLLTLVLTLGIATTYVLNRTLLYSASLLSLVLLGAAAFSVIRTLSSREVGWLIRSALLSGVVFGALSITQLLLATFHLDPLGVLCAGCTSAVFGFPRINLFAAEPQFLANSLLPAFFAGLFLRDKTYTWLAPLSLVLSSITIALTLSRGAYLAVAVALLVYFFIQIIRKNYTRLRVTILSTVTVGLSFLVGFTLLIVSASWLYRLTPNITHNTTVSAISHLSLGVIDIPEKTTPIAPPTPQASVTEADSTFDPQGFVAASSGDRLDAASLALDAWNDSPYTVLFGVGMGNLGSYVRAHVLPGAPPTLTVYMFYVLLLSEIGIVGVGLFIYMIFYMVKKAYSRLETPVGAFTFCVLIAFAVQFAFFGSYINVMYIPVWFGLFFALLYRPPKTLTL